MCNMLPVIIYFDYVRICTNMYEYKTIQVDFLEGCLFPFREEIIELLKEGWNFHEDKTEQLFRSTVTLRRLRRPPEEAGVPLALC